MRPRSERRTATLYVPSFGGSRHTLGRYADGLSKEEIGRITLSSILTGGSAVQALIDIIASLIAMIAAAALSLFGVDMSAPEKPRAEIHRVRDCGDAGSSHLLNAPRETRRDC